MNQSVEERQDLLKKALTGNAVFSVVSGVAILFANRWLVKFLGLPDESEFGYPGSQFDRVCRDAVVQRPPSKNKNHRRLDCGHHGCCLGRG